MLSKLYKQLEEVVYIIKPKSLFMSTVEFPQNPKIQATSTKEDAFLFDILNLIKENKISSR